MDIEKNLNSISKKLSNYDAKLIPVIKNRTVEEVKKVYDYGFREFGENRLEDYYLHSEKFNDANSKSLLSPTPSPYSPVLNGRGGGGC